MRFSDIRRLVKARRAYWTVVVRVAMAETMLAEWAHSGLVRFTIETPERKFRFDVNDIVVQGFKRRWTVDPVDDIRKIFSLRVPHDNRIGASTSMLPNNGYQKTVRLVVRYLAVREAIATMRGEPF